MLCKYILQKSFTTEVKCTVFVVFYHILSRKDTNIMNQPTNILDPVALKAEIMRLCDKATLKDLRFLYYYLKNLEKGENNDGRNYNG